MEDRVARKRNEVGDWETKSRMLSCCDCGHCKLALEDGWVGMEVGHERTGMGARRR